MVLKKEDSRVAVICIIFFVSLLIFEFSPSSIFSDFFTFSSSQTPEIKPKPVVDQPPPPPSPDPPSDEVRCDRSHRFCDVCSINVPTVMDSNVSTLYVADPGERLTLPLLIEKVRPYTRKFENRTMSMIGEVRIVAGPPAPRCQTRHNKSAIVYSAGGFTGHFFHDFNDGFIPLFITINSLHFNDEDVILVVENVRPWWVGKYSDVIKKFTKHPIINLDTDNSTHCFPSATVGLISHGFMTIDPNLIPNSKSFLHFRSFLADIYDHKPPPASVPLRSTSKPRLVLLARKFSVGRTFTNQNELRKEAEELGFEVVLFEPTYQTTLDESYGLLNSTHAMIGIHGAGLTHLIFMRPGSVFLQVVPIGTNWLAEVSYASPARQMGLKYIEYRIGFNESSLSEKYGEEAPVIRDAPLFKGQNWSMTDVYLKQQSVKLDMSRFRGYLKEVHAKAKKFMEKEGLEIRVLAPMEEEARKI